MTRYVADERVSLYGSRGRSSFRVALAIQPALAVFLIAACLHIDGLPFLTEVLVETLKLRKGASSSGDSVARSRGSKGVQTDSCHKERLELSSQ